MCDGQQEHHAPALHLVAERVVTLAEAQARPFVGGIVEMDESYFGPRRVRGRGAGRKTPVIGLLKRAGKVFAQIVQNCSKTELLNVAHRRVKGAVMIHDDGWKAHDGLVLDTGSNISACIIMKTNLRGANAISTGSNPFGALPRHAWRSGAVCARTSSHCTSKNRNGGGTTAKLTFIRCSLLLKETRPHPPN